MISLSPANPRDINSNISSAVGAVVSKSNLALNMICEFADLNEQIRNRQGKLNRYRIHIYSFKKFTFTRLADTLGELAARAIKGDKEYLLTYYKKSREERAEDYRKVIPKLSVFTIDEKSKMRKQVEETIKEMKDKDLAALLEFMNSKKVVRE